LGKYEYQLAVGLHDKSEASDATINVYVLKGVLLDAGSSGTVSTLKDHVFNAISFPGFDNSTYDAIGVEFGLGIMELSYHDEPAAVKIQIWNLNERRDFVLNWRHYLKGSRFGIITWRQSSSSDFVNLVAVIKDCIELCPGINIGLVLKDDNDEAPRFDGIATIESLSTILERTLGACARIDEDLEAMMIELVSQSLDNAHTVHVLSIRHDDEIRHVPSILNPFLNYLARVSDNLLQFLVRQGIHIEDDNAILESNGHICRIDLANASLHVASKQCATCRDHPCCDAFSKVCVVLNSQIKKGYSSESLGLTPPDLFVLSMVFAIQNNELPPSVLSQFPKAKPCTRRR
jgi:hypothetical protein